VQATGANKAVQFIVTTFHPQIVEVAAKAYGVEHARRVSTIRDIGRAAALEFVRNDTSHRSAAAASRQKAAGGGVAAQRAQAREEADEQADGAEREGVAAPGEAEGSRQRKRRKDLGVQNRSADEGVTAGEEAEEDGLAT
jgi:hypothetical protein